MKSQSDTSIVLDFDSFYESFGEKMLEKYDLSWAGLPFFVLADSGINMKFCVESSPGREDYYDKMWYEFESAQAKLAFILKYS